MQGGGGLAGQAAGVAAIQTERDHVRAEMGGFAGAEIGEAGQQSGADEVVVTKDGGAGREVLGDVAQLAAVQQLAVGEVDVGDGEGAEIDDLADPVHDGAGGEFQDQRFGELGGAPHGEAMDAAGERDAGVAAAQVIGQRVDIASGFLHQEQVRVFVFGEADHVTHPGAGETQQVPADNLRHAASVSSVLLHCTLPRS